MSSDEQTVHGASTDQHITGREEEETFLTDEPPTATTPASGSSNAGINKLRANQQEPEAQKLRAGQQEQRSEAERR
ncbi:hypothetical protein ACFQS1_01465 [Paractinoplanes rhizophilus]|jgi:hypothetical protein|uniref:Uncharacterized protein n=1 Tax=Paractinoplanes rhizophilus TaxID=1416877 RepID=A0ABW2HLR5_9ACTN